MILFFSQTYLLSHYIVRQHFWPDMCYILAPYLCNIAGCGKNKFLPQSNIQVYPYQKERMSPFQKRRLSECHQPTMSGWWSTLRPRRPKQCFFGVSVVEKRRLGHRARRPKQWPLSLYGQRPPTSSAALSSPNFGLLQLLTHASLLERAVLNNH